MRRSDRMKRLLIVTGIISSLVIVGIVAVFGYTWSSMGGSISNPGGVTTPADSTGLDIEDLDKRVSVILVGADQRPGDKYFNTDSIIVASVDPETKRISLLSIPRDTLVSIPRHPDIKINSVVALSDFDTLEQTVTNLTSIPISGYILTNFQGFKSIIDTLGGIELFVEKDMYYETGDKEDGVIDLKQGVQTLDGAKALQYARFRHDALADISRTQRQQKVLQAIANKMLKLSSIPKLPWLIPQVKGAVQTNLSLKDMLSLAKVAASFNSDNVISQTLPGGFKDIDGISYWEVLPDKAKKVAEDLLNGVVTKEIIDHVNPDPKAPVVPGGPNDPNGRKSSGYKEFEEDSANSGQSSDTQGNPTQGGTQGDNQGNTSGSGNPGGTSGSNQGGDTPVVPGGPTDPNGQGSTGYQAYKG